MRKLLNCSCTDKMTSYAPTILRVVTGLIFAMHGWMKITGGVANVAGFLGMIGFPVAMVFAYLLIAAEFVGGIFLVIGLYTHWAAKFTAFVAAVAFLTVHVSKGFSLANGGYEYIILLLAASISIMITGPGAWSLDGKRKR